MAVLIDRPPEVVPFAMDGEKDLIQMPLVARSGAPAAELIGIGLPELPAPMPDGFVGHDDPTREQELFDIAIAQAEAEVQPDAMADDLGWETVMFVAVGRCGGLRRKPEDG